MSFLLAWWRMRLITSVGSSVCVCAGGREELQRIHTMECRSWEEKEVRDMLALSMPSRLLPLCPSARQHPDVPSRAATATATAQTLRLPMSVYLSGKVKTQCTKGEHLIATITVLMYRICLKKKRLPDKWDSGEEIQWEYYFRHDKRKHLRTTKAYICHLNMMPTTQ